MLSAGQDLLAYEWAIRLAAFTGVLAAMALWELASLRLDRMLLQPLREGDDRYPILRRDRT